MPFPHGRASRIARAGAAALIAAAALIGASCHDTVGPVCCGPPAANTVVLNGFSLTVKLAATAAARSQGLMGVTAMAADSGMLFVFKDDRQRFFWMKNTPLPLSIAFLDSTKKVIYLANMAPNDSVTLYGSFNVAPMRYALEVNQGWFASHGVTVGMTASFTLPTGLVIEPDPSP